MRRPVRYVLIAVLGVVVAAVITLRVVDSYQNPGRVAYMLNISAPPASLHVLDCESGPITDIVITCAIEVDPREFPLLLAGYPFAQHPMDGTSYTVGFAKIGREFPVAVEYSVQPATFKHGGFVKVFADRERKRALVDLYIE